MIEQTTWRNQPAVTLRQHDLAVTLLPDIGAKIISLTDEEGREFIWQNPESEYAVPTYGTSFGAWDLSGWDECFPTIAPCTLAEGPWAGVTAPCHGELWCVPHEVSEVDGGLRTVAHGVRFPYVFQRTLTIPTAGTLRAEYRVTNPSAFALPYVYSVHPLLAVGRGTRIRVPDTVREVRVDNTIGARLGGLGDTVTWPKTALPAGGTADLSVLTGPECSFGDKVYSPRLDGEGWCGYVDPERGVVAGFRFDPRELPRIGIWQNQGMLPGQFNLALEPCTGYPDRLDLALLRGEARWLPAKSEATWSLTFVASAGGEARLQELLGL